MIQDEQYPAVNGRDTTANRLPAEGPVVGDALAGTLLTAIQIGADNLTSMVVILRQDGRVVSKGVWQRGVSEARLARTLRAVDVSQRRHRRHRRPGR